jgi:hypothetical protein
MMLPVSNIERFFFAAVFGAVAIGFLAVVMTIILRIFHYGGFIELPYWMLEPPARVVVYST